MSKTNAKTIYFYEGETEKNLLVALKTLRCIPAGNLKKFNLWESDIKNQFRTFQKTDQLRFVIDTDTVSPSTTFVNNIKHLKPYIFCLIIQNTNLEDELRISCSKSSDRTLFNDFYNVSSKNEFKTRFAQDKKLQTKLLTQNFDFNTLWQNTDSFDAFCRLHSINPRICKMHS
ncbi:MAG: hypothetical protein L3J01_00440 [Thiomicrorhabdus sp.]|nr:hypothetical protein [Thiomicrorhabdus sp.]